MSNSMSFTKANHDDFEVFLQYLAGLFMGLGVGLAVAYRSPPKGWQIGMLAMFFGICLNGLALYRTKRASQNRINLQTK